MPSPTDSDPLDAARIATASIGVAFVLAAIGAWFLNYGIAIGFGIGAAVCFIAANQFHDLANTGFRIPFTAEATQQRGHWQVFRLITYTSVAISLIFSIIFGTVFYLRDLQDRVDVARHGRHLKPEETAAIIKELSSSTKPHFVYVFSTSSCDECAEYALDFREAISRAPGWKAGGTTDLFGNVEERGLKLYTKSTQNAPEQTKKLAAALTAAHLKFDWIDSPDVIDAYEGALRIERAPR